MVNSFDDFLLLVNRDITSFNYFDEILFPHFSFVCFT